MGATTGGRARASCVDMSWRLDRVDRQKTLDETLTILAFASELGYLVDEDG